MNDNNFVPDDYRRQRGAAMVAAAVDGYVGRTTGRTVPTTHPSDPTGILGQTVDETVSVPTAIEVDPVAVDPETAAIFGAFVIGGLLLLLTSLTIADWIVVGRLLITMIAGFAAVFILPVVWNGATNCIRRLTERRLPVVVVDRPVIAAGPGVIPVRLPPVRSNV